MHPIQMQLIDKLDRFNSVYVRDEMRNPIGLVMIGESNGVVCKGVSICSVSEKGFDKDQAIKYAAQRLLRAFKKQTDDEKIDCDPDVPTHSSVSTFLDLVNPDLLQRNFKQMYNIEMTELDQYILGKASD